MDKMLNLIQGSLIGGAIGDACISSLTSGKIGTIENPINNSKGCGGVMRVAPVGLIYPKEESFDIASKLVAITHGHPSGYISEEALAISVYCALKYKDDFKQGLISSVNHNGDSDSTGAITGNILGRYLRVDNSFYLESTFVSSISI